MGGTYIYTAGKTIRRELEFKLELVNAFLETAFPAQDQFVLEEGRKAISQVLTSSPAAARAQEANLGTGLAWRHGILEHLHVCV